MNHPLALSSPSAFVGTSIVSPHAMFFGSLCSPKSTGGGVATRTLYGTSFGLDSRAP